MLPGRCSGSTASAASPPVLPAPGPAAGVIHFEGASAALADAAARGGDASEALAANELVFGAEANLVDITPLICDAILASLPTVCLCGGAACRAAGGVVVVAGSGHRRQRGCFAVCQAAGQCGHADKEEEGQGKIGPVAVACASR